MNKNTVSARLNRVAGQIQSLSKKINEEEIGCYDALVQIKAIQKGIDAATSNYVQASLKECIGKKNDADIEKILTLFISL